MLYIALMFKAYLLTNTLHVLFVGKCFWYILNNPKMAKGVMITLFCGKLSLYLYLTKLQQNHVKRNVSMSEWRLFICIFITPKSTAFYGLFHFIPPNMWPLSGWPHSVATCLAGCWGKKNALKFEVQSAILLSGHSDWMDKVGLEIWRKNRHVWFAVGIVFPQLNLFSK